MWIVRVCPVHQNVIWVEVHIATAIERCDITESKDISAVRHRSAVKRIFAICMVAGEDTISALIADRRLVRDNPSREAVSENFEAQVTERRW